APDELLDTRLGVLDFTKRAHELDGIGDLPDGPDGHLDLLTVLGGDVDKLFGRSGAMPDLEGLRQAQDLLDERELEIESRLGATGDGFAELEEHGQLALVDGVED